MNGDPDRNGKKLAVTYFNVLFQNLEKLRKVMLNTGQEHIKINMLT
jgi:hypothetical protein